MEVSNLQATEPSYMRQDFLPPKLRKSVSFDLPQAGAESSSAIPVRAPDDTVPSSSTVNTANTEVSSFPGENDNDLLSTDTDPFLLVSLRDQRRPPPRPKFVILLYLIAILDLAIVCTCNVFLIHNEKTGHWRWGKAEWDLTILALLRFLVVIGVASSTWISKLRWILGGACCLSSLYIIFKSNFMFQHKKPTHGYSLIIIASSFLFSQIHWVANIIVTSDARRRSLFLRNNSIIFEEEDSGSSRTATPHADDALINNQASSSSLRSYGTTNDDDTGDTSIVVSVDRSTVNTVNI